MRPSPWTNFLNSLATPGGGQFLMFILVLIFLPVTVFVMVEYGPAAPVVTTITTLLAGFAGALMNASTSAGRQGSNTGTGGRSTDPPPTPTPHSPTT